MKETSSRSKNQPPTPPARRPLIRRPLTWVITGSVMCALAFGVASTWYQLFPPPPDRVVDVYRTPRCSCAPAWIRSLEAGNFVVRVSMIPTLRETRRGLDMPPSLHGCHVGVYLNYFLEGHVASAAVRDLAIHRPEGRGLITQAALEAAESQSHDTVDENSPVLLLARDRRSWFPWYRPRS